MKTRRLLATLLSFALMLSLVSPALAAGVQNTSANAPKYGDTAGHWAEEIIDRWSSYGVIKGDEKGNFNPDQPITRGAMATVVVNLLGLTEMPAANPYADLQGDEWYADAVLKCTAAGIMNGDGNNFNATANITRQEATLVFARALGIESNGAADLSMFVDGGDVAAWAVAGVSAMAKRGIITGVGNGVLAPLNNIDRASTIAILDKAISTYVTESGTYAAKSTGITLVRVGGVTLTGSAQDILIAAGASGGSVKLDQTIVSGNITINAKNVTLTGTGSFGAVVVNADNCNICLPDGTVVMVSAGVTGTVVCGKAVSGGSVFVIESAETPETPETPVMPPDIGGGIVETEPTDVTVKLCAPGLTEMTVGDSRSIDFIVYPESNQQRSVTWTSSNPQVATVDKWGRVTAVAAGFVDIIAVSKADDRAWDAVTLNIVDDTDSLSKTSDAGVVDYTGSAAAVELDSLQKYVDRYTTAEALASAEVPQQIKTYLSDPTQTMLGDVTVGDVTWSIGTSVDGYTYGIKRIDMSDGINERDRVQYFMGDRYLPTATATFIGAIMSDGANGLWVAASQSDATLPVNVTHIRMEELTYTEKAAEMSAVTQEDARYGFTSGAYFNGTEWVAGDDDNDGLWTAMYGVGELMRYSVLKNDPTATADEVAVARDAALRSVKAVLLLANVSCRTGTVEALVRPAKFDSNWYQNIALLKGKDPNLNTLLISPADMLARSDDETLLSPFVPEDWGDITTLETDADRLNSPFETRTRSLAGFICRTLTVGNESYGGGNRWKINSDDTATCVRQDWTNGYNKYEEITTVDASGTIPEILLSVLPEGTTKYDITYKADTSTDEIIGHLFIYKVAYDILDDSDPEEAEIKAVIQDTMRTLANHFVDNGYSLRDAAGQGTSWGKTERDYFTNPKAWEDCALNSLVGLNVFKVAAHVTGEKRWEDEYRMLALEEPYRYADLAGEFWNHLKYVAYIDGGIALDSPDEDFDAWVRSYINFSDEEMAMLAYYLLFQMETDPVLLDKYRDGINSWWNSIQYSENPLWYYIYQLAYPTEVKTDAYGNVLIDTAAWALSRYSIDTRQWSATAPLQNTELFDGEPYAGHYTYRTEEKMLYCGYHPECIQPDSGQWGPSFERSAEGGGVTHDPETGLITSPITVVPADERQLHKYNDSTYWLFDSYNPWRREACTIYTLPYWMGRYHNMLQPGQ